MTPRGGAGNPLEDYVAYLGPDETFTLYVHAGSLPDGITRELVCLTGIGFQQNIATVVAARGPDGSDMPWVWSSPGVLEVDATGSCQSLSEGGVIAEIDLRLLDRPEVVIQPCGLTMGYEDCTSAARELTLEFFEGVILNPLHSATESPSWSRMKASYSSSR